jgi:site-specific DNA-methyltransferase (adenine-specific)
MKPQRAIDSTLDKLCLDYRSEMIGRSRLLHADAFEWLSRVPENSLHAIVTDPPYGVKEYNLDQIEKRENGNGGIWRIPPSFDGHIRAPLPRFTALNQKESSLIRDFFTEWAKVAAHALRPGAHVFIASNSFLSQLGSRSRPCGNAGLHSHAPPGTGRPASSLTSSADPASLPRRPWTGWLLICWGQRD